MAAVSAGIVDGAALLDLDYPEDSSAEVDANVVMTGDGGLIEVQATAERTPLSRANLDALLALAAKGVAELQAAQERAVGARRRVRLVLATRNAHKVRELAALLDGYEVAPLPDDVALPPETGETFAANALPKARAAAAATGEAAFGDDSGIESAALGGAPGVRSARFAGEDATDADNLALLIERAPPGSALAYVCVIALVDPRTGEERLFEGRCTGTMAAGPARLRRLRLRPDLRPRRPRRRPHDGRAHAGREGRDQPSRPRRAGAARPPARDRRPRADEQRAVQDRRRSAVGRLELGAHPAQGDRRHVTGSVALLTEALHSATDLVASIVALFSLRAADVPADESHPYGHEKIEDMAAAIEGVLILVGSVVIAFEAVRHLIEGTGVQRLGVGIVVLAVSIVVNFVVSRRLSTRAAATSSPALAADAAHLTHRHAELVRRARGAGDRGRHRLGLARSRGRARGGRGRGRGGRAHPHALLAGARRRDAPRPRARGDPRVVIEFADAGIVGFHELRGRQAGARRHVDLHVQFRAGMTLEEAHGIAHRLQAAIRERLGPADVLIHLEPEDRVRPGQEVTTGERPRPAQSRLIAADAPTTRKTAA